MGARGCWLCLWLLVIKAPALAATLEVRMLDANGTPLQDAVLAATPLDQPAASVPPTLHVMAQKGQRFTPHLLLIRRGDRVEFPNLDRTRHHVYSFSAARRLELKLYLGTPAQPLGFDTAGIVTLGCNIHDWMLGYIVVVDAPYRAQSGADGRLLLDLPGGRYRLWAWHPRMDEGAAALDETVELGADEALRRELRPTLNAPPDLEPLGLGLPPA